MNPALRKKLDACYAPGRTLSLILVVVSGLWALLFVVNAARGLSSTAPFRDAVGVPLVIAAFGGVGLALGLRSFLPVRSLENAPVTRLMREEPGNVARVYGQTKTTTRTGNAVREVVVETRDGRRLTVPLGVLLPGFEEDLVARLLAGAPGAKAGPDVPEIEPPRA